MTLLGRSWRWLERGARRLYLRLARLAMIGEVKGRILVEPADFEDPEFGSARAFPGVLEIDVEDAYEPPGNVGWHAKQAYFKDDPRFLFNVVFSCGETTGLDRGTYTDPRSHWFNVFFGYYQLDAPVKDWARPLGYRTANPDDGVAFFDIARIGKADWNWFSNHLYGVPHARIAPFDEVDMAKLTCRHHGRVRVGESDWDRVTLEGVQVVSAYTAPGERHLLERTAGMWSTAWRLVFGLPCPREEFTQSFMPTTMRAELLMSCRRVHDPIDAKGEVWRTLIFGGTARMGPRFPGQTEEEARAEGDRFLEVQLRALRGVMERRYATDGFAILHGACRPAPPAKPSGPHP